MSFVFELDKLKVGTKWIILVNSTRSDWTGYEKDGESPGRSPCIDVYAFEDEAELNIEVSRATRAHRQFVVFAVQRCTVTHTVSVAVKP